ncbi:MAG: PilZ domain-containing protein [Planctomycetota bacterium]
MAMTALRPNRRKESRYRTLTGQQMSWNRPGTAGHRRKGWVLDVSRSGMGLMMEDADMPEVGEVIGIKLRPASEPVSYEVVRIQDGNQRIRVVGCERIYGRTTDLDLPMPKPAWKQARSRAKAA